VDKRADTGRDGTHPRPDVSPYTTSGNNTSISFSERLRLVPDVLESLISEKRLLQAAVLLVRSLKTIKNQDMLDIGAVSDLRAYLIGQESVSTNFPLPSTCPASLTSMFRPCETF
jgi:hypothetical protein